MTTRKKSLWLGAAVLMTSACDPDAPGIRGVEAPTGFAVTHGDYVSSAIALLGPDGDLEQERFVHSGTVLDGLGSALSGDVVLPTTATEPGVLTFIERKGTDRVTRIDIAEGTVISQSRVQVATVSAYQPNPQDYLQVVGDDATWITRNEPNLSDPIADDPDDVGNDLLMLPLTIGANGVERIDLTALNTTGPVTNPDTGAVTDVVIYARPTRMVKVGDVAIVGLERVSLAYDAIGSGMVAVADLNGLTASPLALTGLSNCGSVTPIEGDAARVLVSCAGSFIFDEDSRDAAGLAIIHVVDGVATIEHTWAAADHSSDPVAVTNPVSLGGTRAVVTAVGDFATTTDNAYVLDVATGDLEMVAEAGGSYVLGGGAYNAATKTLLLPDASTDTNDVITSGLRRFQWNDDGEITELDLVQTDPTLPVRSVGVLR